MSLLHSGGDESIALRSAAIGPSTQARLLQLVCGADADQGLATQPGLHTAKAACTMCDTLQLPVTAACSGLSLKASSELARTT